MPAPITVPDDQQQSTDTDAGNPSKKKPVRDSAAAAPVKATSLVGTWQGSIFEKMNDYGMSSGTYTVTVVVAPNLKSTVTSRAPAGGPGFSASAAGNAKKLTWQYRHTPADFMTPHRFKTDTTLTLQSDGTAKFEGITNTTYPSFLHGTDSGTLIRVSQ